MTNTSSGKRGPRGQRRPDGPQSGGTARQKTMEYFRQWMLSAAQEAGLDAPQARMILITVLGGNPEAAGRAALPHPAAHAIRLNAFAVDEARRLETALQTLATQLNDQWRLDVRLVVEEEEDGSTSAFRLQAAGSGAEVERTIIEAGDNEMKGGENGRDGAALQSSMSFIFMKKTPGRPSARLKLAKKTQKKSRSKTGRSPSETNASFPPPSDHQQDLAHRLVLLARPLALKYQLNLAQTFTAEEARGWVRASESTLMRLPLRNSSADAAGFYAELALALADARQKEFGIWASPSVKWMEGTSLLVDLKGGK